MAAVTICSDFGAPQNKVWHCFHCFSIYLPWSDGTRCHDLRFLNVEVEANFFTLLFHFHQEAFSSSSLSAIRVVSSAYLRLLIFLLAILIPACASSSLAFHMMFSAYKLISRVTIYSLDVLLFLFGTSLLFHVQFELLLPDLHIGFSRGRSGGLIFLSLSEFSAVYCDPHSQRFCHSQ